MMNIFQYSINSVIILLLAGYPVKAHPVLDYPAGGEEFTAGNSITIEWYIAIEHDQEDWDLYFSPDGGQTWQTIIENLEITAREYSWIVPDISTDKGQIRIVMDNVEGTTDYEDVSPDFSIHGSESVTGIENESDKDPLISFSIYPNPFSSSTQIDFTLKSTSYVNLAIYGIHGKEVTTLLNKELKAGKYEITWNAAGASDGIYICRLLSGDLKKVRKLVMKK